MGIVTAARAQSGESRDPGHIMYSPSYGGYSYGGGGVSVYTGSRYQPSQYYSGQSYSYRNTDYSGYGSSSSSYGGYGSSSISSMSPISMSPYISRRTTSVPTRGMSIPPSSSSSLSSVPVRGTSIPPLRRPLLRTRMVMPRRRRRRRRRPPSKFFQCDQPNLTRIKIGYFPKLLYLNLCEYF